MSLNVYLELEEAVEVNTGSGIYVRVDGQTVELSMAEWNEKFPNREPVILPEVETNEVYWANITHNLTTMAAQAGIYKHLWRPDEINIQTAKELIDPLQNGLSFLQDNPDYFKTFNPDNGWGDYNGFVKFVTNYLTACRLHPEAKVRVSR